MPDASFHCRTCGEPVLSTHRFCPQCGELYPAEPADRVPALAGPLLDLAEELRPLLAEKGALARRLEALAELKLQRPLTPEERQEWEQAYARWRDVSFEITLAVDRIHPRREPEVTEASRGSGPEPSPPHDSDDRRDPFWHRAP